MILNDSACAEKSCKECLVTQENKRLQTLENFRQLFTNSGLAMFLLEDKSYVIRDANKSALEFYGYTLGELQEKDFFSLDVTSRHVFRDKKIAIHQLKNGIIRYVQIEMTPIESANDRFFYAIIIDMTDKIRFEEELFSRRLELEQLNTELKIRKEAAEQKSLDHALFSDTLFDHISLPLALRDENFHIVKVNKAYEEFTGYSANELKNHISLVLTPSDCSLLEKSLQLHDYNPVELTIHTKNGDEKYIYVTKNPLLLGEKLFILSSITDLTLIKEMVFQQQRHEELLAQQAKLAAMGEMIGNIAHQWRQPISQLSGLLTSLLMKFESEQLDSSVLLAHITHAEELIGYMSQTIDDFRNFFKPEKHKVTFSLNKCIEEALSIVSISLAQHNIIVVTHFSKDCIIEGYPNELLQVATILLSNAKDALLGKGEQEGKIMVSTEVTQENIKVKICDNAGGISPDIMPKIFDPYFTTKHKSQGTGIGLYMAKIIIEKHFQGELKASNVDKGACFSLCLNR